MTPERTAVAGLTALAVAMGIGRFAFTPILPMMQADAGVSVAAGGWLAAANYVGYLAGALTATRVGLRAPATVRAGVLTIGLTTLAMGATDHPALWLVLRAVAGVASAWVLIHVSAWSLERLGPARPALGGLVFAGVGVGIALAGVTCVVLMSLAARSAHAWGVLGVLALVLGAVIWPVFRADDRSRGPLVAAMSAARLPTRDAVRLVLCYGAFGFGYIIPATFVPVMARAVIDDPIVFGSAWPLFGIAAALTPVAVARWSAAQVVRRVWIVAQVVLAIGVALPVVFPGMLAIAVAACAVGGTFMVITMAGMQEARRVAGPAAPRLMAAMTAAFGTGQIVGPLCVSAAAWMGAGFAPALLLAAVALVASAGALEFSRGSRSPVPAPTPSSTSPAAPPP